jgi:hypothetical protein
MFTHVLNQLFVLVLYQIIIEQGTKGICNHMNKQVIRVPLHPIVCEGQPHHLKV